MKGDTITCEFTCDVCGVKRVPFDVPLREQWADVGWWLNKRVRPAMGAKHREVSPNCKSGAADLHIPFPGGTKQLGGPVVQ